MAQMIFQSITKRPLLSERKSSGGNFILEWLRTVGVRPG